MSEQEINKKIALIMKLAKALHIYGATAQGLEAALGNIVTKLGIQGEFFATPTVIMASFETDFGQRQSLVRVKPGNVNLEKMTKLDMIGDKIIAGQIEISAAMTEIDEIVKSPSNYPPFFEASAFSLVAGAASVFFGSGIPELLVSLLCGFLVGILFVICSHNDRTNQIFEFIAAFVVAFVAGGICSYTENFSIQIVSISSLIVLVPGLGLTVSMTELATNNLAAGTARLMQAILVFFKLGFGAAIGTHIASFIFPDFNAIDKALQAFPTNAIYPALVIAAMCFTILFYAKKEDYLWVLLACCVGYFSTNIASNFFGADIGAFIGGLCVGMTGNLFSRSCSQPAALIQMPGLILLVPGSVGFRGLSSLFTKNTLVGIDTTFEMFLIAIALVSGLLLANIIISPNRSL